MRIGRIRSDGQFDIVWDSRRPVRPTPFPDARSRAEWEAFLNTLFNRWGGRWVNEDRRKAEANRERHGRLSVQLIAWFLAIALVPLAIVTVSTYLAAERALRDQVTTSPMRRQTSGLRSPPTCASASRTSRSRMPGTIAALEDLGRVPVSRPHPAGNSTRSTALSAVSSYYQEAFGYDDLLLVVPDGRVVFSARARTLRASICAPIHTGPQAWASRSIALGLSGHRFLRLRASSAGDIEQFLGAPSSASTLLGVVILRLDGARDPRIVSDRTGLGETGETLLNRRIGDEAVIMVPVRGGLDPPFTRRVALGSRSASTQRAVQGSRGEGVVIDHWNRRVLAVWRYVPALAAGLVVKIDANEAYAPIRQLALLAIILAGTTIALVVVAAVPSRGRSPIRS